MAVHLTHSSLNHLIWCHQGSYYVNSREQDEQRNCETATVLAAKEMKMDSTEKPNPGLEVRCLLRLSRFDLDRKLGFFVRWFVFLNVA